ARIGAVRGALHDDGALDAQQPVQGEQVVGGRVDGRVSALGRVREPVAGTEHVHIGVDRARRRGERRLRWVRMLGHPVRVGGEDRVRRGGAHGSIVGGVRACIAAASSALIRARAAKTSIMVTAGMAVWVPRIPPRGAAAAPTTYWMKPSSADPVPAVRPERPTASAEAVPMVDPQATANTQTRIR